MKNLTLSVERVLIQTIRWGLLVLIAVLPFVVTPFTVYPFIFGKLIFLQIVVEFLLALYIPLAILAPRYRPRWDRLTAILLGFTVILITAAIFGVDFFRSFWGTEERATGLLAWLHWVAFFVLVRAVFRGEKDTRLLLRTVIFSGIGLSLVALLRLAGVKLFGVELGFRLSGTIANPAFFAAMLIFEMLFALLLSVREERLWLRVFFGAVALGQLLMLFMTLTRGAILGFLGGLFVFFVVLAWRSGTRARLGAMAVIVILIAAGVFVRTQRDSLWIRHVPPLRKMAQLSLADTTARTRLLGWEIAYRAFLARPLLGWGPENFSIAFNQFYNPELLAYSQSETWFDRPHNILLEMAVNAGISGLLFYVALFAVAGAHAYKRLPPLESAFIIGGLGAYLGQNLFIFDTPSSLLLFFLLLALVELGSQRVGESESGQVRESESREIRESGSHTANESVSQKVRKSGFVALVITIPLAFFAVWKVNVQPLQASSAFLQAMVTAADYSPNRALPEFAIALALPTPYTWQPRTELVKVTTRMLLNGSVKPEDVPSLVNWAANELNNELRIHPREAYTYFLLGRLYTEAALIDPSYFQLAQVALDKSLELSPNRQQTLFGVAKLAINQGDFEKAKEIYAQTVALEPRVGEAHWYYAALLNNTGEFAKAQEEFSKASTFGYQPRSLEEALIMTKFAVQSGDARQMVSFFEAAVSYAPERADLQAQLALAYREWLKILTDPLSRASTIRDAQGAARRAAELDPSYGAEAKIFLSTLPEE
ncbi:MAG: O-antigen ligase family protein [Patescibacteria group bacterium]